MIDVWVVDKDNEDGYTAFVDICEDFDDAVQAVYDSCFDDREHFYTKWLSEPEPSEYSDNGWYVYEYYNLKGEQDKPARLSYTYYIFHFVKERPEGP